MVWDKTPVRSPTVYREVCRYHDLTRGSQIPEHLPGINEGVAGQKAKQPKLNLDKSAQVWENEASRDFLELGQGLTYIEDS